MARAYGVITHTCVFVKVPGEFPGVRNGRLPVPLGARGLVRYAVKTHLGRRDEIKYTNAAGARAAISRRRNEGAAKRTNPAERLRVRINPGPGGTVFYYYLVFFFYSFFF